MLRISEGKILCKCVSFRNNISPTFTLVDTATDIPVVRTQNKFRFLQFNNAEKHGKIA